MSASRNDAPSGRFPPPPIRWPGAGVPARGTAAPHTAQPRAVPSTPAPAAHVQSALAAGRAVAQARLVVSVKTPAPPLPSFRPPAPVVQRMGKLSGIKHGKNVTFAEQAIEVPIGGWWYTTEGTPLYTKGVGNCLAIVLNDPESDSGAMAHLHDLQAQDFKKEKTTGDKLATYAGTVIGRMLAALGKSRDKLEIMLWKGISFTGDDADIVAAIKELGWKKVIDLTDKGTSGRDMDKHSLGTGLLYTPKTAQYQFAGSMKFFTFQKPIETELDTETYRAKATNVKDMMEMYFAT